MKRLIIILGVAFYSQISFSQEIPITTEQQLENLTDANEGETEDDTYLQELENFRRHPLNINTADAEEFKQLRILTDLQIINFITYRNLFGKLISLYELQAVPSWDIGTIKKLVPFITTATAISLKDEAGMRFRDGEHSLLLRGIQVLEKAKGFDKSTTGTKYLGSPQRVFFRYRYTYKNLLQFGIVGDKDAGEQFLKGAQNKGFDFYSFHLFARKIGIIQSLALGDFSVNLGQGLTQWQGLAFKKSVDVMGVKRQSATLRPYNSAGEFYFNRGAGVTIKKGKIESTVFASIRKLSANFVADTVNNEDFISSFLTSGYNRTPSEQADRNNLRQTSFGGNILFRNNRWHVGANAVFYNFSLPVVKREEPYNRYAISGNSWYNMSFDYSYTYKNMHFFGEAAIDKRNNKAFVNGLLVSVDPRVDLSIVQRTISKGYQSINGNAFTENTFPTNETGIYAGVSIRPAIGWKIDAYADFYKFPWLKFLVDAPSYGKDFLAQVTFTPNRQVEIYTRFKTETKQANQSDNTTVTNFLVNLPKQNWRTQISYKLNTSFTIRNRVELLWFDNNGVNKANGFLTFFDFMYKPMLKPLSAVLRLQYFETDDYNSRIYAYENDILYGYSIPGFFDKGFRYYLNLNYDLAKNVSVWLRLAQTVYRNQVTVGSGLDEIQGNRRTEVKVQIRWIIGKS
ncbi:MAG: helix-hairpin-helix domain-containing protein [Chitinophagaceae bacterium]|nr:helix-hairpin-helix domain-containing protein [Chitinophagaceae bacterium]MBK8606928.1 helix-hairpin-helix domain-containing protein [Chitinophagaceae bacterium]MBP7109570.1 helix-hairpin-helix domain-containing protein [Chitinophagaceae bacterium]MBP7316401.1 helix-hairpin-helix domain-containing protein [Chitinophagaceae bacterium]